MSRRGPRLLLLVALLLAFQAQQADARQHGLELGLADAAFTATDAASRQEWLGRAEDARADLVMLSAPWSTIAPRTPPAGFEAADPAEPSYDWSRLDGAVRDAVAAGLEPVLNLNYAPRWAEGPGRPSFEVAPAGTWLPDAEQLGRFAQALAGRYSGGFVDPADPGAGPLPRVRYFQVWAEQNLSVHLNPLWRGRRLVGPAHYRAMLNAAYAGIHRASPSAQVIVGGLAPYGDRRAGGKRVPPVWFWRSLLCLRGSRLRPVACPEPAHFDIAAHNPIDVFGPTVGAVSPLDVSVPDVGRLTRIVRRAVATGRALPAHGKPFWATEIWWDSRPPDPDGVPLRRQARYLSRALFELWRQGAAAVVWWFLRDQAPGAAGFAATQQSGLLFRDGRPKPALRAFRFPFVALRQSDGRVLLWGRAPATGRLALERHGSDGWRTLARLHVGRNRVFAVRVRAAGSFVARARRGGETSLLWRVPQP